MKLFRSIVNIALFLPIMCFSQANQGKEEAMYAQFEKGYHYRYVQKDSAYHYLENALTLADEIDDYDASLGILDHMIITADYHHDLSKFRTLLQEVNTLLSDDDIALQVQDTDGWRVGYLIWLASYHFETMEYVKAKALFLEARGHFDDILPEQHSAIQAERLYTIQSSLGTTYMNLGNYELAALNYQRCIQLVNNSKVLKENADAYLTGTNQSIAQLYTRMGKHEEANAFYIKNLDWSKAYYQKDNMFKNNVVNAFQKITISYIQQDSLQQALRSLNESQPYLLENDPFYKDALVLYGDIYTGLGDYKKAFDNYQNALGLLTETNKNATHLAIAQVQGKIATLYLKQEKYRDGLETVQKAFNASGKNIAITTDQEYPDPTAVYSKTQLLNLLDIKLQLLELGYKKTLQTGFKNNILETCHVILNTFDLLKREFDSKFDKKFLAESAYPIFHRMLDAVYEIVLEAPSSQNIQLALNIAEKNKDFLLLEALRSSQASDYGDMPRTLLDKEVQLRSEITYLEKEIFDAANTDDSFSENLFQVKQEYYSLLEDLKNAYPKYHHLKYQTTYIDLENIREILLVDHGAMISYTLTESHLFAIIMNGKKEKFLKIPFSEQDRQMIRDFYQLLSKPSLEGSRNDISKLGSTLYESLLKLPLEGFDTENLTVIPDGELHYLPFDMLEKNEAYLLQSMNLSYGNSVASLLELHGKNSEEINVLGFAPSFKGMDTASSERQFGKLRYNGEEVGKIEAFYNAKAYLKKEATLQNFVAHAPKFNVIHLATHASANDEFPDYSYLAFTDETAKEVDNILYIKDLYNMTLPADMVILSACQTGIGTLQKGQGMMSLSKGFYYAGAKSLVNTLWKINDKSTVTLMEFFYEGLSRGMSKTGALRSAKLKYLESTDDELLKHPYYWAAFVVSGDVSPISNKHTLWWIVGMGVVALLLAGFFLKRRKRFNKIQP